MDDNRASNDIITTINLNNLFSKKLTIILVCFTVALVVLHCLGIGTALLLGLNHFIPRQLLKLFYLDSEYNVSSWFNSALLLLCAFILFLISLATLNQRLKRYWAVLAILFMLLSIDETVAIHEWLIPVGTAYLSWLGNAGWLLIALPIVVIVGVPYLFFLIKLPYKIRLLFIIGGIFYITGAIVFEFLGAQIEQVNSSMGAWLYRIVMTLEETFEITGLIIFLHGATSYLTALLKKNTNDQSSNC